MKSILISEETHKKLINLKLNENEFLEASRLFRKRMDEKGLSLKDLLKAARKVRKENSNEHNWNKKGYRHKYLIYGK